MNSQQMKKKISIIFENCLDIHTKGQKEYANNEDNVFANFERVANRLDLSKEEVLLTYLLKHIDGIVSYVKGVELQWEDVRGRLTDAIVYLCLLWGMFDENKKQTPNSKSNATPIPEFVGTKEEIVAWLSIMTIY